MTTKAQQQEIIKLQTEQHEELILTIIGAADTIRAGLNDVSNAMSNQPVKKGEINSPDMDIRGIPTDSVHHPQNPELSASPWYIWDAGINMWRKK